MQKQIHHTKATDNKVENLIKNVYKMFRVNGSELNQQKCQWQIDDLIHNQWLLTSLNVDFKFD